MAWVKTAEMFVLMSEPRTTQYINPFQVLHYLPTYFLFPVSIILLLIDKIYLHKVKSGRASLVSPSLRLCSAGCHYPF